MRTDLGLPKLGHKARHRRRRLHLCPLHHPTARQVLFPGLAMHALEPHLLPRQLPQRIIQHPGHDPLARRLGRQPVPNPAAPHRHLAADVLLMATHWHAFLLVVERAQGQQAHYRSLGRGADRPLIDKATLGALELVAAGEGLGALEREREGHAGGIQAEGDGVGDVEDAVEFAGVGDEKGGEVDVLGDLVRAHIADRRGWGYWIGGGWLGLERSGCGWLDF